MFLCWFLGGCSLSLCFLTCAGTFPFPLSAGILPAGPFPAASCSDLAPMLPPGTSTSFTRVCDFWPGEEGRPVVVFAYRSDFSVVLRFSVILLQDSMVNLLAWDFEAPLDLWAFQDSAEVCVCHRVLKKVMITLKESSFVPNANNSSNFRKALSVQMQDVPHARRQ